MTTRLYSPMDYRTVKRWWTLHGVQVVPKKVLPKCGVVVVDEGKLIAAGWLYLDNSVGVAWASWIVTNPAMPAVRTVKALKCLLGGIESVCKSLDYGLLFTMTNREAFGRFLKKEGWGSNHSGMTQYFRRLK